MRIFLLLFTILLTIIPLRSQYLITNPDSLLNNGADYLIITHESFTDKLYPLCRLRDSLGLAVKMVEANLIYSTFPDNERALMIKRITQQVYDQWVPQPQYILLVGDASRGDTTSDYIPSKLFPKFSYNYLMNLTTHASDNWYVQLDGSDDYLPELAIGRFPVNNPQACESLVEKTIRYETTDSMGIWRKILCIVTSSDYEKYANILLDTFFIPAEDSIIKVYERLGPNSTALREKTVSAFNQGIVFLFMVAHGSSTPMRCGSITLFNSQ